MALERRRANRLDKPIVSKFPQRLQINLTRLVDRFVGVVGIPQPSEELMDGPPRFRYAVGIFRAFE